MIGQTKNQTGTISSNHCQEANLETFISVKDKIKVAVKPQNVDKLLNVSSSVRELLSKVDERRILDEMTQKLGIYHLLDRQIQQLSGGELQRMAICATILGKQMFISLMSLHLSRYTRENENGENYSRVIRI